MQRLFLELKSYLNINTYSLNLIISTIYDILRIKTAEEWTTTW